MNSTSTDRRVRRTRQALHRALVSLIRAKDYEAITIKDIIDEADVGRSTFYAHFTGKEDLFRKGFEHLRELLVAHQKEAVAKEGPGEGRTLGFSLAMFEHAREHEDVYRALVGGRGGAIAVNSIRDLLSDLVRDEIAATGGAKTTDKAEQEIIVQFTVGAFMGVLTWWLDRGARVPPEEIDAVFRGLALKGFGAS